MVRTNSERPEPRSPVSPITSPLLIVKSNGRIVPAWPNPLASINGSKCFSCLYSPLISAKSSKSFPIILDTNFTRGSDSTSYSPTNSPFLSTVIRSHTSYTCSKKCVTKIIPTPSALNFRIRTNNFWTSSSSKEDVGSSKIKTRHFISTALAIAIICWIAKEHSSKLWVGATWISRFFKTSADFRFIVRQSIIPNLLGSLPINKFSATVRFGHKFTSWYTVLIPFCCASCGEWFTINSGLPPAFFTM